MIEARVASEARDGRFMANAFELLPWLRRIGSRMPASDARRC
jgi:hypothetical protein